MPAYAADLEQWWLTSGREAISRLLDLENLDFKPRECGFAQEVQHKIREFDANNDIYDALEGKLEESSNVHGVSLTANHRKLMKEALCEIFKSPVDGGLVESLAVEGLGYLDAVEEHRRRLVSATRSTIEDTGFVHAHVDIIEELDRAATFHYGQFHMGFRACVSFAS